MNAQPVFISGVGCHVPEGRLGNTELASRFGVTEDWIVQRTGIRDRSIAPPGQSASDLALAASVESLRQAGLTAEDLDLIVVATNTPDQPMPATACILQRKLGARGQAAFDVTAACSGFVYALSIAAAQIKAGMARHALVVGVDLMSRVVNPDDRSTSILFGDAAGAVVVSRGRGMLRVDDVRCGADGAQVGLIRIPGAESPEGGGSARAGFIALEGKEVFRAGVELFASQVRDSMERSGLRPDDVAQVILHQSNARMIEAAAERTEVPADRIFNNVARYGNTGAASIPVALAEYLPDAGQRGAIILAAVGAGLTWGSATLKFV